MTKHYDYIAIGGGSGGIASINRAAMYGQKCALIEAKELGGKIEIVSFVRYEKGEGLEKKVDDFASEVASMVK